MEYEFTSSGLPSQISLYRRTRFPPTLKMKPASIGEQPGPAYQLPNDVLVPLGTTVFNIDVVVFGNIIKERNKVFIIIFDIVGVTNSAQGTILNDDEVTISSLTQIEGNTGVSKFTFLIALSSPVCPGGERIDLEIHDVTTSAGIDYLASQTTIVNLPEGASSYSFAVEVRGDIAVEQNEKFNVIVHARGTFALANGVIQNDDQIKSLIRLPRISEIDFTTAALGEIIQNVDILTDKTDVDELIRGRVSADGVTKLLLVIPSGTSLDFSLPSHEDGFFSDLQRQTLRTRFLNVQPIRNSAGEEFVIVVYTAPDSYGSRPGYLPLDPDGRPTEITIRESNNVANEEVKKIRIFSPPVVLMHGIWSSAAVWEKGNFAQYLSSLEFKIEIVNYKSDEAWYLGSSNRTPDGVNKLRESINRVLKSYKDKAIAASQVDVVAHSMGALMTRTIIQSNSYKNESNYFKGSVHKLISLGTPHFGTPLANILWQHRKDFLVRRTLPNFGMPIKSAVKHLGQGSKGLEYLNRTEVKSYSIAGSYMSGEEHARDFMNFYLFLLVSPFLPDLDIIHGGDHDVIVPRYSQRGGLADNHFKLFTGTIHSEIPDNRENHTHTNSTEVQAKVKELLLSNNNSDFSSAFPKPIFFSLPGTFVSRLSSTIIPDDLDSTEPIGKIKIVSPSQGAVISSQSDSFTLEYVVIATSSLPKKAMFLINNVGMYIMPENPPYRITVGLPKNKPLGKVNIGVVGRDSLGYLFLDTSFIIFQPVGTFGNLSVFPKEIIFDSMYMQQRLLVTGYLNLGSDTSVVDLSDSTTGVSYKPQKGNAIVKIDGNGNVRAVNQGIDSLEITFGSLKVTVPVTVKSICSIPKPVISSSGNILTSSNSSGNQWYLDEVPIDSAKSHDYLVSETGLYQVETTIGCSSEMSDPIEFGNGNQLPQTILFDSIPTKRLGDVSFIINAVASSGLPVTLSLDSTSHGIVTIEGNKVTLNKPGKVTIIASQAGNDLFDAAVNVIRTFFVEKDLVHISWCGKDTIVLADAANCLARISWIAPSAMYLDTINVPIGENGRGKLVFKGMHNGHGYYESTDNYMWPDARDIASALRGHLASITSPEENMFILNNIPQPDNSWGAWIGLYNTGTPGNFAWVTGEPVSFTYWNRNEPNNHGGTATFIREPYVHILGYDALDRWNDIVPFNTKFIAEFDSPVLTYSQISGPDNGSNQRPGVYKVCYEILNNITQHKDTCCLQITVVCNALSFPCPKDIMVTTNSPDCMATLDWTPPTSEFASSIDIPNGLNSSNNKL